MEGAAVSARRGGVVYLVHHSAMPAGPHEQPWTGYWEREDPPGMLAEGSWHSAAGAVAWARERCDAVIVRVGLPGELFSAGERQPPGENLPEWPPGDADRFDP
jgi:hypothetical protein